MSELRTGLPAPADPLLTDRSLLLPDADIAALRQPPPPMSAPAAQPPPGGGPPAGGPSLTVPSPPPGGPLLTTLPAGAAPPSGAEPSLPSTDQNLADPHLQALLDGKLTALAPSATKPGAAPAPGVVAGGPAPVPSTPPSGAVAPGTPSTQYGNLGDVPVVGPVPAGVTPMFPRDWANRQVQLGTMTGGRVTNPSAESALKMYDQGWVLGNDNVLYRMKGGDQDPGVIAQKAGAQSGGTRGGTAPFEQKSLPLFIPGVGNVGVPASEQEVADYNANKGLSPRLQQLVTQMGGGTPGGGSAPGPGGPGGAVRPAVQPIPAAGYDQAVTRVSALQGGYDNASKQLTTIGEIKDLMNNPQVTTGPFADYKAQLGAKLKALGVNSETVDNTLGNVADTEALKKALWGLGTQAVTGALGGGQAGYVLEEGLAANPNIALQPGAIELMTNIMGQAARAQRERYLAASQAFNTPPATGYGVGGQYGAVTQAENQVMQRYSGENILHSAQIMTKEHAADGWQSGADPRTGAPNALGNAYVDLIPPGATFYNAHGDRVRKDAAGNISKVQ